MNTLERVSQELQAGNHVEVQFLTGIALEEGFSAREIMENALIAGMDIIGVKFREHEIFLPEVLLAARAMQSGVDILKPHLEGSQSGKGRAVVGTVKGDLHDIGKNLVSIMLRGAGFEIIDLGKDVSSEEFVNAALDSDADILGLSALLTTTMPAMKETVDLLRSRDPEGKIKVIIGGAPTSHEFASEIGADGYAFDAVSAVDKVKELMSGE